jgi:hypothetical protein
MKKSKQALFCFSFIFFSCGQTQQKETPEKQDSLSQDVVKSEATIKKKYWPLDTDTLLSEKEILIDNESFNLKISRYCHNDSAVVNEGWSQIGNETQKELHISHNYSNQITLTKGNKIIFDNHVSKDALKERLVGGHYKRLMLYDIQYEFAKENKLYFKATLVPRDTSWIEEINFTLFYQTEKAGQIDFWDVEPDWLTYNDLKLYDLTYYKKSPNEKIGFTSLSDNYPLSEHPDSLAIPDLYSGDDGKSVEDEYFKLSSRYRERFLAKTKISETDTVFVYNYSHDTLASFRVKNLPVVACLNAYRSVADRPHSQMDYMIGFEIGENVLKDFGINYYQTLVYVGKENPFVQGQLKPIVWKETKRKDFPSETMSTRNSLLLRRYEKGGAYKYETNDFGFFVQEFLEDDRISARRLLIIDLITKETVRDEFYFDSESSSPAPLNYSTDSFKNDIQWTGSLFKNKPPVIFGFEYISFGCTSITFLHKSVGDVGINCDNRH